MPRQTGTKESKRKKSLGELGELIGVKALVDAGFDKIRNLNDVRTNYPYADLYAEKDNKKYVVSIKARNKFQQNGKLNSSYVLGTGFQQKARQAEIENDAEAHWMAIQFDKKTYSVFFGSLKELAPRGSIPLKECANGEIGECLAEDKRHYFNFSYFKNKKR